MEDDEEKKTPRLQREEGAAGSWNGRFLSLKGSTRVFDFRETGEEMPFFLN